MDMILQGCDGTMRITDDIVVFGDSPEEHDRNLHKLMLQARKMGLVLNPNKCVIRMNQVNFFGMVYTKDGVRPDPKNHKKLRTSSVKELQQFLGLVQYMSSFIPNLSDKTSVLRDLTKKLLGHGRQIMKQLSKQLRTRFATQLP